MLRQVIPFTPEEVSRTEIIHVHEAVEVTDERGSYGNTIGKFFDYEDAKHAAKGKGAYGQDGSIKTTTLIQVTLKSGDKKSFELSRISEYDMAGIISPGAVEQISRIQEIAESLDSDARKALKAML